MYVGTRVACSAASPMCLPVALDAPLAQAVLFAPLYAAFLSASLCISLYLPASLCISLYLPGSLCIAVCFPRFASLCVSLAVCSRFLNALILYMHPSGMATRTMTWPTRRDTAPTRSHTPHHRACHPWMSALASFANTHPCGWPATTLCHVYHVYSFASPHRLSLMPRSFSPFHFDHVLGVSNAPASIVWPRSLCSRATPCIAMPHCLAGTLSARTAGATT